ncbi:unnamed protein product [Timema podura]|uniref:protein-tyrosine-phosphatase n=1 Tax=Timema podura TaxID=61482 RepID=A0ABN7NQU5_TIMPD|nr:unnamed protein product [Timema podura]
MQLLRSSRVKLSEYVGVPGSNYINANFIRGASGSPAYIASQGPLPHTVNDFWRMVVEWDVQVIVMACSVEEAGKGCVPTVLDLLDRDLGRTLLDQSKATRSEHSPVSVNQTTVLQVERKVCQYHYVAWPDHGVPSKVRPLVDMVRKVRETQVSETVPVLVHCSAGCGRTGTICAIDYVWGLLRSGKLSKDFSLFKLVQSMRKQRIAMVQTKEQYILVHQAVRELFNDQLRVIESHPYENIDINGMPLVKAGELAHASISSENTIEGTRTSLTPPPTPTLSRSAMVTDKEITDTHSYGRFAAPLESGEWLLNSGEKERNKVPANDYKTPKLKYICYEKQDIEEKEVLIKTNDNNAPFIPQRKKSHTAFSKHEKEVENLTEKQRSMVEHSTESDTSSALSTSSNHKPRIEKLKALFECNSSRESRSTQNKVKAPQQVTRSHSIGAIQAQKRINAIVAGLGVRERRNSFCRAVNTSFDADSKVSPYEPIWPSNIKQCLPVGGLKQAEEIKRPTLLSKPTKDVHLPIEHHLNLNQTTSQNSKDNVPRRVKHPDEKLMVAAQSPSSNTVSFVTHDPKVIERVFYKRDQQEGLPFREESKREKFTQVVSGWTSSKKSLPETMPHSSKMDPPMQQYRHSKGNFPISKSKSMNIHQCSKTDVAQLDAGASYLPATTFAQQQNQTDEVVSYGLVAGVKFRRGSQDDIALSPSSPPRVRRHASIILLRHSLIETTEGDVAPLSVWGSTQGIQSAGVDSWGSGGLFAWDDFSLCSSLGNRSALLLPQDDALSLSLSQIVHRPKNIL